MTAEEVRAAMGSEMCAVADALRERFGDVKLTWLDAGGIRRGRDPSIGSVLANGKLDEESECLRYWYGRQNT